MTADRLTAGERLTSPVVMTALAACAASGSAVVFGPGLPIVTAASVGIFLLCTRWRTGGFVLLALLPLSGVPALLAGEAGLAFRDVVVVLPLYCGFALAMLAMDGPILPPLGGVGVVLGCFALVAVAYVVIAPTPLAGAIGVRVWVAYLPMLAIGYHLVRDAADFEAVLRLTAVIALIPVSVGLMEWAFALTGGDFGPFERLYAVNPLDDNQRFVVFTTSDGHLKIPRVPSLFTSASQYYAFTLVALASTLALALQRGERRWIAASMLVGAAALTTGARAAYVIVPALVLLAIVLRDGVRPSHLALGGLAAAICGFMSLLISEPLAIAQALPAHVEVTLRTALSEFAPALRPLGHGTGWDTNAALRYGGVAETRYIENWYAKAGLELGLVGLVLAVSGVAMLVASLLAGHLRIPAGGNGPHEQARALSAPLVALFAVTAVSLVKGPYIDLDPMNVYFWLFAGMLFGLYRAASGRDGVADRRDDGARTGTPRPAREAA
jgi:hypothetical protein